MPEAPLDPDPSLSGALSETPRARRPQAAALLVLLVCAAAVGARLATRSNKGDLEVFYLLVPRVSAGLDLYHYREGPDPSLPTAYIYPPSFALAFLPLTRLPFAWVRALWGALGVLWAARALWLALLIVSQGRVRPADPRSPPGEVLPRTRAEVLALLLGLGLALRFVWSDISHGQVNLLVAWLTLEGVAAAEARDEEGRPRREGLAACWLAAAVVLKLTPALIVALYLARRRWRLGGLSVLWGLVWLWLPALYWGPALQLDYLVRFAREITPWNAAFHAAVGNNAALTGGLLRLLVGTGDAGLPTRPLLTSLPLDAVQPWLRLVSAGLLAATLLLGRRRSAPLALGIALAATPLISPLAWKPHLVVLILPALLAGRLLLCEPPAAGGRGARALLWAGSLGIVATGRFPLGRSAADAFLTWGGTSLALLALWLGLALWREGSPPGPQPVS